MRYPADVERALNAQIEQLRVEADGWKRVAVELNAYIADNVLDPNACAVHAYNHARNGRWAEARRWLEQARADRDAGWDG